MKTKLRSYSYFKPCLAIASCAALASLGAGCSGNSAAPSSAGAPASAQNASPQAGAAPAGTPSPSPSPAPDLISGEGWQDLRTDVGINRYDSKASIDNLAHFVTTYNGCGKDGTGVIDVVTFNTLSRGLNQVVNTPPLPDDHLYCVNVESDVRMNDHVDLEIPNPSGTGTKTRKLFTFLYNEQGPAICSTISDPALSDSILAAVNQSLLEVNQNTDNCPAPAPTGGAGTGS